MPARIESVITGTSRRDRAIDALVAVPVVAAGIVEGLFGPQGNRAVLVASAIVASGSLAWRRTHPAAAALAATAVLSIGPIIDKSVVDLFTVFVPVLVCVFSLGLHASSTAFRRTVPVIAVASGASVLVLGEGPDDVVYVWVILALAAGPSRLLRRRFIDVVEMTRRAVRAEVEADERAELARLEERNRLACELHDIVGHSVSLMVVHAAAAERHLSDHAVARSSLDAIQDVGRQAVSDLACSLGLLRGEGADIGLSPPHGLGDLERLAQDARQGGDDVTVKVTGDAETVPAALALTIYRIVQEGLTNARKHAPGAAVAATVCVNPRVVAVDVVNEPPCRGVGTPAPAVNGTGHGVAGLRERVRVFGGTLAVGSTPDGGFALRASIPYDGTPR